ncbi:protein SFI1 homolog isoform X2 [Salarias fasciatus]|uniref:protein SFI1 homolog isoform X2 n=1 Tax=Salarias fasciatus TaxID=181472 RepID=UPI0011769199|nr:protein SFI1 homolog isoform X2 [Salarias fasciatus]
MQSNARKTGGVRQRPSCVTSGGERKQVRKVQIRKIPYRVGYSWNKGGRLKELRIRHLARKFLKIWMRNTFGRVLPHEAKSHHSNVVLRQVFHAWKDEWWTSRREWTVTMRADCHYRYYLYCWTFQRWQKFVSLQKEKKTKVQKAQSFADKRQMRLVWDRWKVFTEMKRMKNRILQLALEQKRLSTIHSVWTSWQTRLQQRRQFQVLENQVLKQRALTSQRLAWTRWKEKHAATCHQKEKESIAALHFNLKLKRRTLNQWMEYISHCQTKRKIRGVAHHASCMRLVRSCWSKWRTAVYLKQSEDARLHAAGQLAMQSAQQKALVHWKAYVNLCRGEAERNQTAAQHHRRRLLRAGLQGLSSNVAFNKTQRLNNNMAFQHWQQMMTQKYWKLWQDRLEEAEDQNFKWLAEMAQKNYRFSLLRCCLQHWRRRLAERRHMQALELRADTWFAEQTLPRCLRLWVEFTQKKRLHEHRKLKAEVFSRQWRYSWVFYTWWGRFEKRKEEMLSERMAILHEERGIVQRAWARWRQRTQQQIQEVEKLQASHHFYKHRLLQKTVMQWRENSTEIRDRRNRELQAYHQRDLFLLRSSVEKWKKFVQRQRDKKSRLKEIQHYNDVRLLKQSFVAWKKHHLQMSQICDRAEELHRQQTQRFLRNALTVWRENAALLADVRIKQQHAQNHFERVHQLKVLLAWREATTRAVSKRHQQEEAVSRAQTSANQVRLLLSFRQWREQTKEARRERMCMERARQHHNSELISKTLKAWNEYRHQQQKKKVMKRQGNLLVRLKVQQTYFEEWRVKLQHRRREAQQTERALWHWSLALQAKVLYGWRLCVTEQRREREEAARAAQVCRDQLLQEGVTRILTYAAHMNTLTTSLTQYSQEQSCTRLAEAAACPQSGETLRHALEAASPAKTAEGAGGGEGAAQKECDILSASTEQLLLVGLSRAGSCGGSAGDAARHQEASTSAPPLHGTL